MKIRTDFVTNSSSSLFTIACNQELSRETLYEAFQIPEEHPLREFMDHVVSPTLREAERETEERIRECVRLTDYQGGDNNYRSVVDKGFKFFYQGEYHSPCHQIVDADSYLSKFHLPTLVKEDIVFISREEIFHIACAEELTEEKIYEVLQIPPAHPLRDYFEYIVWAIRHRAYRKTADSDIRAIKRELEKVREKHDLDIDKLKYFYSGTFISEDEEDEEEEDFVDYQHLYWFPLSVTSKDFVMFKEMSV